MRILTMAFPACSIHARHSGRSFNGRTSGSEPLNRGSTPCLPASRHGRRRWLAQPPPPVLLSRFHSRARRFDAPPVLPANFPQLSDRLAETALAPSRMRDEAERGVSPRSVQLRSLKTLTGYKWDSSSQFASARRCRAHVRRALPNCPSIALE